MEFGNIVKTAVERQGMIGWQFNTIGVSDGITMGNQGRSPQPSLSDLNATLPVV
jgi:dihydroxyacid dehydratase/phosphogluconate dehydratase